MTFAYPQGNTVLNNDLVKNESKYISDTVADMHHSSEVIYMTPYDLRWS